MGSPNDLSFRFIRMDSVPLCVAVGDSILHSILYVCVWQVHSTYLRESLHNCSGSVVSLSGVGSAAIFTL